MDILKLDFIFEMSFFASRSTDSLWDTSKLLIDIDTHCMSLVVIKYEIILNQIYLNFYPRMC